MSKQQRQLAQWEEEADRAREAAGLMSKRKLAAILYSSPDLQRAILGTVATQKGGTHEAGKDQEEQARNTTAASGTRCEGERQAANTGKGETAIDSTEPYALTEETTAAGKKPALIRIAESYLRGYARHPRNTGTDLMPVDQRWTRAVKALYDELPAEDQAIIDSYAPGNVPLTGEEKHRRTVELKRLALLLMSKAGYESQYTILLPIRKGE